MAAAATPAIQAVLTEPVITPVTGRAVLSNTPVVGNLIHAPATRLVSVLAPVLAPVVADPLAPVNSVLTIAGAAVTATAVTATAVPTSAPFSPDRSSANDTIGAHESSPITTATPTVTLPSVNCAANHSGALPPPLPVPDPQLPDGAVALAMGGAAGPSSNNHDLAADTGESTSARVPLSRVHRALHNCALPRMAADPSFAPD